MSRTIPELEQMAQRMRINAVELAYRAGKNGAHLGGGLSAIEIMTVLYGCIINIDPADPASPQSDHFILSKGHGSLAYYTALCECGFFCREKLFSFEQNGGDLPGQPVRNVSLGIDCSSGSLGLGITVGVGLALAAKIKSKPNRTFVLLGDGECNEGSVWEAAMSAVNYELSNLVVIIDNNGLQSDGKCAQVLHTAPMKNMWRGFGWNTVTVDGHDIRALLEAFVHLKDCKTPTAVIANTIKGKGVSFMENDVHWHHGILTETQFKQAMEELAHA